VTSIAKAGFAPALFCAIALLATAASAQAPTDGDETLSWTVSVPNAGSVKPGSKLAVQLRGAVTEGWHVYGLKQAPTGPTPLLVAVDANPAATANGAPTGSAPIEKFDPSFDEKTQYYARDFTVTAPVKVAANAASGAQVIPISVRYQTCNGQICHLPKTVRLSATITVAR
jgi:DsbC/DsbD-like thiol-disulfide interchange protein